MPGRVEEAADRQLWLIEPEGAWDVGRLRAERAEAVAAADLSPATVRAYASRVRDFVAWCSSVGRCPLPASAETLELYLVDLSGRLALSTLVQSAAAIERAHVDAGHASPRGPNLTAVLRGLGRKLGGCEGREPLRVEDLVKICGALGRSVRDVRDRAILCVGFSTGLRRSELSGLDLADVAFLSKGVRVRIRRGKTDQAGAGREVGIFRGKRASTCPVRNLERWIVERGRWAGPLFVGCDPRGALTKERLVGGSIYEMIKRCVALVGLDPSRYGGHSLRAGMITAAAEAGAPDVMIARRSGHKSLAVMGGYVRGRDVFAYNPLARVL